jgi:hypothetical protein
MGETTYGKSRYLSVKWEFSNEEVWRYRPQCKFVMSHSKVSRS